MVAIGDKGLLAVEPVTTIHLDSAGADGLQVATRPRLGHRDRSNHIAAGHARQELTLLRLGAELQQVRRDVLRVRGEPRHAAGQGPGDLFHHDGAVQEVAAGTAVGFGQAGAQQAVGAGIAPEIARNQAGGFPFGVSGHDLVSQETGDAVAVHLVLRREHLARRVVAGFLSGHGISCAQCAIRFSVGQ
ncbi:hypothetical protein D9M70_562170 [compost metagenome]